jgi:hypothetical protein
MAGDAGRLLDLLAAQNCDTRGHGLRAQPLQGPAVPKEDASAAAARDPHRTPPHQPLDARAATARVSPANHPPKQVRVPLCRRLHCVGVSAPAAELEADPQQIVHEGYEEGGEANRGYGKLVQASCQRHNAWRPINLAFPGIGWLHSLWRLRTRLQNFIMYCRANLTYCNEFSSYFAKAIRSKWCCYIILMDEAT